MRNDFPFEKDGEVELRGLLKQALAAPARPLDEAQTGEIVRRLRPRPAPRDTLAFTLMPAAACLTLVIVFGLLGDAGPLRNLAIALAVCNLGLSPIAVLAVIVRRRFGNAT